jgi:hypothetical protein
VTDPLNDREIDALIKRIEKLETRADAEERFRNWLLGAAAVVIYILGLFSANIKKAIGWS